MKTCALCGRQERYLGGGATDGNGGWLDLCHMDEGRDCYHEWTVYGVRPDGSRIDPIERLQQAIDAITPTDRKETT